MISSNFKKKMTDSWFSYLQSQICKEFEYIENNKVKFTKKDWNKNKKKNEGGGTAYLLSRGKIFDKVGVNKSTVSGIFPKKFRSKILGAEKKGRYWASGVSVVAHMRNPKIPAIHFNTRFIVTTKEWFGGGMDVTPSFKDNKERKMVHEDLKKLCDLNKKSYKKYKKWCDEYFFLPHRNESRGLGGIFFDYIDSGCWNDDMLFIESVGKTFLEVYKRIVKDTVKLKWNTKDKELQSHRRSRYVEFNLLHDRGTKFGLETDGNIEAIFMSLPPSASW